MRVSQIQNFTWAGNVLVMGGLVFVGLQFWEARKVKPQKEFPWPAVKAVEDPNAKRWPGEQKAFEHIWSTWVNGKVPPPPTVAAKPVEVDKVTEFKQRVKISGCWETPASPERTVVHLAVDGKDVPATAGQTVLEFKLLSCTVAKADDGSMTTKVWFAPPDGKAPFAMEAPIGTKPSMLTNEHFEPRYPTNIQPRKVSETATPAKTAYLDPVTGHWFIPEEEQEWLDAWGQKNLWDKLATKQDVDEQGVSHGLVVKSPPEANTPLQPHGIAQGDVIRSINGRPVTSKEDVISYLRGDGKGLERYDVVVETNGKERTIVYRVPRSRRD